MSASLTPTLSKDASHPLILSLSKDLPRQRKLSLPKLEREPGETLR